MEKKIVGQLRLRSWWTNGCTDESFAMGDNPEETLPIEEGGEVTVTGLEMGVTVTHNAQTGEYRIEYRITEYEDFNPRVGYDPGGWGVVSLDEPLSPGKIFKIANGNGGGIEGTLEIF